MKNLLLTVALISAAVVSGDLLAQVTSPKPSASSRAAVTNVAHAAPGVGDGTSDGIDRAVVIARITDRAERSDGATGHKVRYLAWLDGSASATK